MPGAGEEKGGITVLGEDIGSGRALGPEKDPRRAGLAGAFKALVKCLKFSGQIFANHLPGCLGAAEVASGELCSLTPARTQLGGERMEKGNQRGHCSLPVIIVAVNGEGLGTEMENRREVGVPFERSQGRPHGGGDI